MSSILTGTVWFASSYITGCRGKDTSELLDPDLALGWLEPQEVITHRQCVTDYWIQPQQSPFSLCFVLTIVLLLYFVLREQTSTEEFRQIYIFLPTEH